MSDQLIEDGSFINSIVGEGTTFRGELHLNGLLRIDGDFTGTIRTSGKVLIGKSGRAECTIRANTVVIGGIVKGNVYAVEKVIVLSTGMMIGNINSPRLIADEGVILNGNCLIRQEESTSDTLEPSGALAPAEPSGHASPETTEQKQNPLRFPNTEHRAELESVPKGSTEPEEPAEKADSYSGEAKRELSSWKG